MDDATAGFEERETPRREGHASRERFVVLGRSEVPPGKGSRFGSWPHPFVVSVSVAGHEPWVALSSGSGHLGAGAVFAVDYVLPDGVLDPKWHDVFEGAGAAWVVPHLADLIAGNPVTEDHLAAEYRSRHGDDPEVEFLPVHHARRPT